MADNTINYDNDGEWSDQGLEGPAIHAPAHIKAIVINRYRIEWLDVSEPERDLYFKNHIVATAIFAQPVWINDREWSSARLSMEIERNDKVVADVNKEWVPGKEYNAGIYTLAILRYDAPTIRAVHHLTYELRHGTTIGILIDKIIERKMHHFLFLPYTSELLWKGCGDHALHCWAVFVRDGDITSADSQENPGTGLSRELTNTYISSGASTYEPIARGFWISYNPIEDELTLETEYSDRRITQYLH